MQKDHDMGQSKGSRIGDSKASKRGSAETTCVDRVSVDRNAGEIGSVLLLERDCEIQNGIEPCAAVIVFALPGVKSCKFCVDLSARSVIGKLRDVSFWYVNLKMAEACKVSMAASETNNMSHDVFFPCCGEGTEACAYHEGCGTKLELESNGVFELPVEIVPHNARTTGKNGNSTVVSSLSEL